MTAKKLTIKQKRFVNEMANPKIRNQTEAAIKAGCPPKNARITASRWLTNANILTAIEKRKQRALAHTGITPEEILGRAAQNMRVSVDDLLNENGAFDLEKARETGAIDDVKKYKSFARIDAETGNCIIKTEIEMYSSADARKEVARYIGLDKNPIAPKKIYSDEEKARELFHRLVEKRGWSVELAMEGIQMEFPHLDIKSLINDSEIAAGQKKLTRPE